MNRYLKLGLLALFALFPVFSFAITLSPPGASHWDLYVYGNGRVIAEVFSSIKLMMVPSSGGGGFRSLLFLLATIGFVVLAVGAGFDPGKNFMRMFTYIFVVWFVTFGSTQLTMNIIIQDQVTNKGLSNLDPMYEQPGVPALAAFPGVITSLVGKYFAESIETNFKMPGNVEELKMAGTTGVGQFNLFGKMIKESQQYVITSPELKKSVSQYMIDCVVPAIALGKLTGDGPVAAEGAEAPKLKGLDALMNSNNLMATLGTANSSAILTKYFPMDVSSRWPQLSTGMDPDGPVNEANVNTLGALVSCEKSYTYLVQDMEENAENLLTASSTAWEKSGVNVGYQELFKNVLTSSSLVGSSGQANGYIMQTALINSIKGSFRQAAIQTGNNQMMQAAALSQAEAAQWSAWTAGFTTFNNMMGYVYTVLQAFIFAITPLIIIALVIPGMGKSIFVNYMQILVWLALWMPTLAIINFLITLFAADSVGGIASASGGPTFKNKAVITESINHLMIAAQFLGTMVPLISWGIVKGAMAFTEFISKGIGNNFAETAGQSAATGNISMNNMSMDNTSMNSFSSATSAKVGFQGVSASVGAGAVSGVHETGGQSTNMNNSQVKSDKQSSEGFKKELQTSTQVANSLAASSTHQTSWNDAVSKAASADKSSAEQRTNQAVVQAAISAAANGHSASSKEDAAIMVNHARSQGVTLDDKFVESLGIGGSLIGKVGVDSSNSSSAQNAESVQNTQNGGSSHSTGEASSTGEQGSKGVSEALSRTFGTSMSASTKADFSQNSSYSESIQKSLQETKSYNESLAHSISTSSNTSAADAVGLTTATGIVSGLNSATSAGVGGVSGHEMDSTLTAGQSSMSGQVHDKAHDTQGKYDSLHAANQKQYRAQAGAVGTGPKDVSSGEVGNKGGEAATRFESTKDAANKHFDVTKNKVADSNAARDKDSENTALTASNYNQGFKGVVEGAKRMVGPDPAPTRTNKATAAAKEFSKEIQPERRTTDFKDKNRG